MYENLSDNDLAELYELLDALEKLRDKYESIFDLEHIHRIADRVYAEGKRRLENNPIVYRVTYWSAVARSYADGQRYATIEDAKERAAYVMRSIYGKRWKMQGDKWFQYFSDMSAPGDRVDLTVESDDHPLSIFKYA